MSIVTRTGDGGRTGLMYGRRVGKDSLRVEAYGEVDELSAALGLARSFARKKEKDLLESLQKVLVGLMGELAVAPKDLRRYQSDGYARLQDKDLKVLDREIAKLENRAPRAKGWSTPGGTSQGAALNLARTVCRRAERAVWRLAEEKGKVRSLIPQYLNRLSDLLWLLEQSVEAAARSRSKPGKS